MNIVETYLNRSAILSQMKRHGKAVETLTGALECIKKIQKEQKEKMEKEGEEGKDGDKAPSKSSRQQITHL